MSSDSWLDIAVGGTILGAYMLPYSGEELIVDGVSQLHPICILRTSTSKCKNRIEIKIRKNLVWELWLASFTLRASSQTRNTIICSSYLPDRWPCWILFYLYTNLLVFVVWTTLASNESTKSQEGVTFNNECLK